MRFLLSANNCLGCTLGTHNCTYVTNVKELLTVSLSLPASHSETEKQHGDVRRRKSKR